MDDHFKIVITKDHVFFCFHKIKISDSSYFGRVIEWVYQSKPQMSCLRFANLDNISHILEHGLLYNTAPHVAETGQIKPASFKDTLKVHVQILGNQCIALHCG